MQGRWRIVIAHKMLAEISSEVGLKMHIGQSMLDEKA